jgi:hypothetical protein
VVSIYIYIHIPSESGNLAAAKEKERVEARRINIGTRNIFILASKIPSATHPKMVAEGVWRERER